jgi:dihydrofolate reductase
MRKLISSINITLDGFCNHTAVIADDELHENANELFRNADTVLFGRKTYQLMEDGWPPVVKKPTGHKAVDEFAVLIDNINKIVFSHTLKSVSWKNATLAKKGLKEEILELKESHNGNRKNLLVGGPSLIVELTKLGLIDEYQFCLQPIVLGSGLPLFKDITDRIDLKLIKIKTLDSGVVVLNYEPVKT